MEANKNKRPEPRRQPVAAPKRAALASAQRRSTTGAAFGETPQRAEIARGARFSK